MFKKDIAYIADLIGDPARSAILIALLEGRALTAGELARQANISPQTASSHLNKLIEGGLICVQAQGRHRYYQLANTEVVHALEALALLIPKPLFTIPKPVADIQYARSCYDHLAGRVGVLITQGLLNQKYLKLDERGYRLTPLGENFFSTLGIDTKGLKNKRRRFAYPCLDWSERVHHLAGSLGASLLNVLLKKRWFLRTKQGRTLHLTPQGKSQLVSLLKIDL
ncbi:MAG: winged helix-turn-helix domain-containing protein [Gammaproteobacteria bacterium]|nr:winged helix-turn-helix domain-containing protein [Gammaproteobacteria bacterium]